VSEVGVDADDVVILQGVGDAREGTADPIFLERQSSEVELAVLFAFVGQRLHVDDAQVRLHPVLREAILDAREQRGEGRLVHVRSHHLDELGFTLEGLPRSRHRIERDLDHDLAPTVPTGAPASAVGSAPLTSVCIRHPSASPPCDVSPQRKAAEAAGWR
jgi:hypothetical protein